MKILGIITARKNSKRIKGKNVKMLGSKPLIQYTFDIVKKEMDEFAHFMKEDQPKEQMRALGRGLLQYAQPNPVARVGSLLGVFDYLRGNR